MTVLGAGHKTHYLTYFAAGVLVGVLAYRYWPQITGLLKRGKEALGRQAGQRGGGAQPFAEVIEDIKKEEGAACCEAAE